MAGGSDSVSWRRDSTPHTAPSNAISQEVRGRPSRDPHHTSSQHQHSNAAHKQPQASTTQHSHTSSRQQPPARWSPHSNTHTPSERGQHSSPSEARPFRNQPGAGQQRVVSGHAQDNSQAHWGQHAAVRGQRQGYSVPYRGQHPPFNGRNNMPYSEQHMPANPQLQEHAVPHRGQQLATNGHPQGNAAILRQQHSSASGPNTAPQFRPGSMPNQQSPSTFSRPAPANASPGKPVVPFRSTCQKHATERLPRMLEYTVQFVPDLSSITLSNSSHAAFVGKPPPAHHNYTAIHDFLAHICPGLGGSFADVWLDTAHITFANIHLPTHRVHSFTSVFTQKVAELPALTSGCYNITDLKHFKKASRRDISTKGSSFWTYYLDLDSTTSDFQDTQELWIQALQKTVHELGGKCSDIRRNRKQHMTVRSFSLRTAAGSFEHLAKAVRANPATMRCAGIRVQQSVDQALEAGNKQALIAHAYFHKPLARYPVPLYISCEAASHGIVLADKQRRLQRRDAAVLEAAVNDILDRLSLIT